MTPLPARLRSVQALPSGRQRALLLALALLSLFNLWLLVFSLDLGLTTAATWWALALAGSLAGLGISVATPGAWPLALASALGTSAAMRSYFALTTAEVSLSSLLAFSLAVGLIAATLSALGQRRALRRGLIVVAVLVGVLVFEQALGGRWTAVSRQLPHLVAFLLLASATKEQPFQPGATQGSP